MIVYPNAKINLGLNILRKRKDGYHDISSVFYPVKDCIDILEISKYDTFKFIKSGIKIPDGENLCEKAWRLLHEDYGIGNVRIHLHKQIPIGSGLGGGSSDASFTLKALNKLFELNLSNLELEKYALFLGSDCPFFINNRPKLVEGIGEKMTDIDLDLSEFKIKLINPEIHVSTKEAYSGVTPHEPELSVEEIIQLPVNEWKEKLRNDFEDSVFEKHSELEKIKEELYHQGSIYSSMSGSGSVLFGIFK
ncbi:MAG: 4-(cytidine 5'-diphospho)-2-C-methyl-D-erythritol kinase [Flavobacteriales bacterium]|nr:4-(cytidine 5'-diphospho)-2-C-methyl-D-erythritol kinase [Flavobacteriales bacterium]|tara:strand:- start:283 stop:1029 length:747 start_codon:yes stop_codon:yes gene_type:complete